MYGEGGGVKLMLGQLGKQNVRLEEIQNSVANKNEKKKKQKKKKAKKMKENYQVRCGGNTPVIKCGNKQLPKQQKERRRKNTNLLLQDACE